MLQIYPYRASRTDRYTNLIIIRRLQCSQPSPMSRAERFPYMHIFYHCFGKPCKVRHQNSYIGRCITWNIWFLPAMCSPFFFCWAEWHWDLVFPVLFLKLLGLIIHPRTVQRWVWIREGHRGNEGWKLPYIYMRIVERDDDDIGWCDIGRDGTDMMTWEERPNAPKMQLNLLVIPTPRP
jgi:hypothetical protein